MRAWSLFEQHLWGPQKNNKGQTGQNHLALGKYGADTF